MTLDERIIALNALGERLDSLTEEDSSILSEVPNQNPWFTNDSVKLSLTGIKSFLKTTTLKEWTSAYEIPNHFSDKVIALVLAGNIPLVGFHDVLCVLLAGHKAMIKLSAKDSLLLPFVTNLLRELEPRFSDRIIYADRLKSFDSVIATGSDNSARYFEYYFGKYPHLIRKNRSSCAILSGDESTENLSLLGLDIFSYYGLGCRNVSKLFVPEDYNFATLFELLDASYHNIIHHHKFCNNYDYQKAIMLVNRHPFLDTGFLLVTESERTVSPISVVYYEKYKSKKDMTEKILQSADKIQCIVGNNEPATIRFGKTQFPAPWDYADQVDTLQFLCQ